MTLRSALLAIASVVTSFLVMWLACVRLGLDSSPAVLSAALAVTLTRDAQAVTWRSLLRQLVGLPVVALGAGLVGFAFTQSLALGGTLFSLCVALSIWLRRFGPTARALGRIIALPFVAMLIVPVRIHGGGIGALMAIAAGVVAVLCSSAARWTVQRGEASSEQKAPASPRERTSRIDPPTRMALQCSSRSPSLLHSVGCSFRRIGSGSC
jgi:hypothetical protein